MLRDFLAKTTFASRSLILPPPGTFGGFEIGRPQRHFLPERKTGLFVCLFAAIPTAEAGPVCTVRAVEKFPVLSAGGCTDSNVNVTKVSETDVFIGYAGDMATIKMNTLSPDYRSISF